jgi:hypothetical protein
MDELRNLKFDELPLVDPPLDELKNLKFDELPLADPPKPPAGSKLLAALKFASALRPGKLMGRFLFGCFCSMAVGVVMNLPYLKMAILWICQAILFIFGRPDVPEPVKKKFDEIVVKGHQIAERAETHKERHPIPPLPALKERVESKVKEEVEEKATRAAVAPVKEAAEKVKDKVERKVAAAGGAVKQEARKVGEKIDGIAGSLADAARERRQEAARREAEAERQDIIRRAATLHIPWEGRPIEEVRDAVTAAEAKLAPNAQCPYCHLPRRIKATRGEFRCPRCRYIYAARTARSLGPPAQRPAMRSPFLPFR